jgi:cellulose synthase/poly-beta-1,6-N-acetylglucosamine synthase-like glycosyltransferase
MHRWARLLRQQTSITVYRLPTKKNKLPFFAFIIISIIYIYRYIYIYIHIYIFLFVNIYFYIYCIYICCHFKR